MTDVPNLFTPALRELQMFRLSTVATLVAAGLTVAGCGSDSTPTTPDTSTAPSTSFRTEKSPAGPGAQVTRGNGGFFATVNEPGAPYFVLIGASAAAVADFCSGGDPEFGNLHSMFVEAPNGNVHVVFKTTGKVPLLLYRAGTEDLCDGKPIAQGSGLYTDISSNLFGGHGRGTAGFRIRGQVTDKAGVRHHVLVVVQSHLTSTGFKDVVRKVKVT